MSLSESPFFYNSTLLFSDETMEKIQNSVVGIAGVGGVGSVAAEMLVRLGVGNLRIADPDIYEPVNMNRQLFATQDTLGKNKALAASQRLKSINPDCRITTYEEGIVLPNIKEFCKDADVLLCQCDRESSKTLLHRAAQAFRIPVVSGARSSIYDHRWKVKATVRNYQENPDLKCYDEIFHPDMTAVPFEKLTEDVLKKYDEKVKKKDRNVFKDLALKSPEFYGNINPEDLQNRIETSENFNKRTVCAIHANTAGCLAATAVLKVLIGGPEDDLEINLWTG